MVLDSGVKTPDSLHTSLTTAIERALTLDTWVSRSRERVASETFIGRHTEFDSVDGFCAACPCDDDTIGGVQRLSTDERNAFVARTTDFETWAEMKQSAAVEDLVTLQNI
jgi:site-specific DNA-cytosine methylase